MDNWIIIVGVAFYVIFGMLLADTLLAKSTRYFMIMFFWFPILIIIILLAIVIAIAVKAVEFIEYVQRIRIAYF